MTDEAEVKRYAVERLHRLSAAVQDATAQSLKEANVVLGPSYPKEPEVEHTPTPKGIDAQTWLILHDVVDAALQDSGFNGFDKGELQAVLKDLDDNNPWPGNGVGPSEDFRIPIHPSLFAFPKVLDRARSQALFESVAADLPPIPDGPVGLAGTIEEHETLEKKDGPLTYIAWDSLSPAEQNLATAEDRLKVTWVVSSEWLTTIRGNSISAPESKPGYHIRSIPKGVLGESSKIREELEELLDAEEQGARIMALVELSDLVGAVDAYLGKHYPTITLEDLVKMHLLTKRAFENGRR